MPVVRKLSIKAVLILICNFTTIFSVENAAYLTNIFPATTAQIYAQEIQAKNIIDQAVTQILAVPKDQRTFTNTVLVIDRINLQLVPLNGAWHALKFLSPDAELRQAAEQAILNLAKYTGQRVTPFNPQLYPLSKQVYAAFKEYVTHNAQHEQLSTSQTYLVQELAGRFKQAGLDLPEAEFAQAQQLMAEINQLGQTFDTNISADQRRLTISPDQLTGLAPDFLSSLSKDELGNYLLGCDCATYYPVIKHCQNSATRKKIYHAFNNRAYPTNTPVLAELIAKRDQLAKLLGFASYAHLDLADQMVQTPERAQAFLLEIQQIVLPKAQQEVDLFLQDLPTSVELVDGKIAPWDLAFLQANYCQKYLGLDEQKVTEYFPQTHTIPALLNIYEQFLDLKFKAINTPGLWSDDVQTLAVYTGNSDKLLGYILLDLFPRTNKFGHGAALMITPAILTTLNEVPKPAVATVIANFSRANAKQPALLSYKELTTFFHELGHALHILLGKTELALFSGYNVKTDFLEVPSQMLEHWLQDAQILKQISCHYLTGAQLPNDLITQLATLNRVNIGCNILTQITYGALALDLFTAGPNKDWALIKHNITKLITPHLIHDPNNHLEASFIHLTTYGAKYYSYLWANVFAHDLFAHIKQHGLLNSEIGKQYSAKILGQGGQQAPDELLTNFLGHPTNNQAFAAEFALTN